MTTSTINPALAETLRNASRRGPRRPSAPAHAAPATTAETEPAPARHPRRNLSHAAKARRATKAWHVMTTTQHSLDGIAVIAGLPKSAIYPLIDLRRDLQALGFDPKTFSLEGAEREISMTPREVLEAARGPATHPVQYEWWKD